MLDLPVFKEVIVVEGKDDVAAVKRACRCQTIITRGLGISREIIEEIRAAKEHCGVIILTDPDGPGAKIRQIVNAQVPGCKNAYVYHERKKKGPVGVEHCSPPEIIEALRSAKGTEVGETKPEFTLMELVDLGLTGGADAGAKRDFLARQLKLGQTNNKQFLRRLNDYRITREDFLNAYREMEKCYEEKHQPCP